MAHLSCGNRPLARCSNQPWCGGILSSPNRDASHPDSPRLVPLAIIFHAADQATCTQNAEGALARSRAADDFPAIRARMEELKRERAGTTTDDDALRRDAPLPYAANGRSGTPDRSGISPQLRRGLLGGRSA